MTSHARRQAIWEDLVPADLAARQAAWERAQALLRARATGATFKDIAIGAGITLERVRQLCYQAERTPRSPFEVWASRDGDLWQMSMLNEGRPEPPIDLGGVSSVAMLAELQRRASKSP